MNDNDDVKRIAEVIRLIEVDHKSTTEYIARISTLRTATRGVIIPLASALAGLALANHSWILAFVGVPIVLLGAMTETRWDFLLRIAHNRLMALEYKVQAYINYQIETGVVADDAKAILFDEFDRYQFGISRSLRGMSLKTALGIASRTAAFWLHVMLVVALVVIGVVVASTKDGSSAGKACLLTGRGVLVEVHDLPVPLSGRVKLVPCP